MTAEGLIATCVRCGSPQPLVLTAARRPCGHCGVDEPLDEGTRARVRRAADLVASASDQQVPEELAERAGDLGWMAVVLVGCSFLFGGGLALSWVANDLPPGVGLVEFAIDGRAPKLPLVDRTAFWWIVFALAVTLTATFPWVVGGQLRVSLLLRNLRALPPPWPGGPARCRLCGDALPSGGLVRRCGSCRADNLVDRGFRKVARTLDDALAASQREARRQVQRTIGRIENGILWAAGFPFLLLLVFPVSLVLDGPHPELWWIPGALLALGALFRVLVVLLRPRPSR